MLVVISCHIISVFLNRILVETKEMLEEQLATSRKRSEKILELENDIIRFKGDIERFGRKKVARIKDLS